MYDDFSEITENIGAAPSTSPPQVRVMSKDEILRRYNDGERNFSGIIAPNSDFSGMNMAGIIFRRAKLAPSVFKGCNLKGADFSFAEIQDSCFDNADLRNAKFPDAILFNSSFRNAKISGASFHNAKISDCDFKGCDINSADFSGATKESAFKGAVMAAAQIIAEYKQGRRDFSGVLAPNSDFSGQNLSGIILRKANLHFCSFYHTDLTGADLSRCDLTDCAFDHTMLRNANMSGANLYWSRINGATMDGANLKEANMAWCNLSGTDFSGCDITKANMQWSLAVKTKLTDAQFFSLNPDALETMKLAHQNNTTDVTRTVSVSPENSYIVKQGSEKYMQIRENMQIYGAQINESTANYSPKGKKNRNGYTNHE
jgi:uncharacterized protein YjbI with pentapeptide repeats